MNRQSGRARAPYYNPRHTGQVYHGVGANLHRHGRHLVPVHAHAQHQQGTSDQQAAAVSRQHGAQQQGLHQHHQGPGRCNICSYAQLSPESKVPVYHRHFSSLNLRNINGSEVTNTPYLCPSCRTSHVPYPKLRTKLVISDSSLHCFFDHPPVGPIGRKYKGDILHTDYLTIPGASIHTLTNAFRIEYVDTKHGRPLDVCVVAGYNDLVRNYDKEYIRHRLQKLSDMVLAAKVGHVENTIAISTLMYPPQLAWFADNGAVPYPGYINQKEKIDWLNVEINQENRRNNVPEFPGFHTYGVRTATRKSFDLYGQEHHRVRKSHRWEHWREADPANMLHLRNDRRLKMGIALNNYFIYNTDCS